MNISGNTAWRGARALLCLALLASRGAARDRDAFAGTVPPSLPEPNPLSAEVHQGETVQITLSAYSLTSPIIRYRIRQKPRLGTLSPSPYVNGKTGLVTYTPTAGGGAGEDEFTYAVQSEAGFSAPETVKIKIIDSDPQLTAPLDLDFGEVVAGESSRRTITLENLGGGTAEGSLKVPEGWSVEGAAAHSLRGEAKQTFTLVFAPGALRAYSGEIEYTGDPERATDLKGAEVPPVEIGAARVILQREGMVRTGAIPVRNRTSRLQTLQVKASPRLGAPETMQVPPKGSAAIPLKTREDDYEAVAENVEIAGAGTVTVEGEAIPPDLQARPEEGDAEAVPVEIENEGAPAQVQVSATGDFEIAATDRTFALGHGEKRTVAARGRAGAVGKLLAVAGANRVEAALRNDAMGSSLTTASTSLPPDDSSAPQDALGSMTAEPAGTPRPEERMRPLTLRSISNEDAVLHWNSKAEGTAGWRVENKALLIDGTDSKLLVKWVPMENVEFTADAQGVSAHLARLQPHRLYVLRMTALGAQGQTLALSGVANIVPGVRPRGHGVAWVALIVAALGGGVWFWRRRARAEF